MANVQPENGWFKIANELAEAFMRFSFSPYEWKVLWCLLRYSYGWHKTGCSLTHEELAEKTGMNKRHVYRAIKLLKQKNVVIVETTSRKSTYLQFQKDYEKWQDMTLDGKDRSRGKSRLDTLSGGTADALSGARADALSGARADTLNGGRADTLSGATLTPKVAAETACKPNNGNGLRKAKDSIKDSIKDNIKTSLSLTLSHNITPVSSLTKEREKLEQRVKTFFPRCVSVPKGIPTEKLFLFVYRLHHGEIRPDSISSPVAYMKGMLAEDVGPLLAKIETEARVKAARLEKDRQNREAMARHREDHGAEMSQMIREFVAEMEEKYAVGI